MIQRDDSDAANRERWHQTLDQLHDTQVIDGADQNSLIRHYNERARNLEQELARIAPEYLRRVREDGEASANQWLAETATAMGRRDAAETRQVLSGVSTAD